MPTTTGLGPANPSSISIETQLPALRALRRDLHAHPELAFREHRTAGIVAAALRLLGLEVHEGVGRTGVVGSLRVGGGSRSVGLRADMDALPLTEQSRLGHASQHAGVHHGCGHDGHTAMLIGAAQQLAGSRDFDGTVHFIFQPAEEGEGGARVMIGDGLFERFPCDRVFALHNWPDLPLGEAQTRVGPIMAAADRFDITLSGRGGHAAQPHRTPDVLLAASELVVLLNTIVARRIDPSDTAVLSVTRVTGGSSHNILPSEATLTGTVRSFAGTTQDRTEQALRDSAAGIGLAHGVAVHVSYLRYYPATRNSAREAALALAAASAAGILASEAPRPAFTSEDFAFMLQQRPGAYLWLGQGGVTPECAASHPLHHPCYDFNDAALPLGVRWLCEVARQALAES